MFSQNVQSHQMGWVFFNIFSIIINSILCEVFFFIFLTERVCCIRRRSPPLTWVRPEQAGWARGLYVTFSFKLMNMPPSCKYLSIFHSIYPKYFEACGSRSAIAFFYNASKTYYVHINLYSCGSNLSSFDGFAYVLSSIW